VFANQLGLKSGGAIERDFNGTFAKVALEGLRQWASFPESFLLHARRQLSAKRLLTQSFSYLHISSHSTRSDLFREQANKEHRVGNNSNFHPFSGCFLQGNE
jgi:hypothetical protein